MNGGAYRDVTSGTAVASRCCYCLCTCGTARCNLGNAPTFVRRTSTSWCSDRRWNRHVTGIQARSVRTTPASQPFACCEQTHVVTLRKFTGHHRRLSSLYKSHVSPGEHPDARASVFKPRHSPALHQQTKGHKPPKSAAVWMHISRLL
jgi:hypothetical protein